MRLPCGGKKRELRIFFSKGSLRPLAKGAAAYNTCADREVGAVDFPLLLLFLAPKRQEKPPVQLGVNKKLIVQKKTSCAKIEVVWRPHD